MNSGRFRRDKSSAICVLKYIDGEMRQSWAKLFEHGIVLKKTLVHISRNPVGDFDGDGRAELALSVLNENGDNAWHTLILEAATGAVKHDLHGCHLLDIRTVEGIPLLFLSKTEGSVVTQAVDIAYLKDGQPVTLYTAPLGFECDVGVRSAPHISYQRSVAAIAGIDTEGAFLFFERTESGLRLLRLVTQPDGGAATVRAVGEIASSHPASVASMQSAEGEALISVEAAETETVSVSGAGIALDYVASQPGEFVGAQPLIADFADGVTRVVVQSESDKIDVFAVEETDGDIRFARCFSVAGHGMATTNYMGPALLDIHGDRSYALAAFTHEGGPALTLFDMRGGIIWRKPFEDVEYRALVALMPGKLRGDAGDDLLIFIRKGDMHSEYGIAIDGRTGDTLWARHEGVFGLAFGGEMTAIDDINGDGQNEVIIIYPHNIAIREGKTGALLASATTLNEPRFWGDPVSFYASPSTYDFLGNGTKQFLYGASNYVHAVIDFAQNELNNLWGTLYPMWAPALPTGIGDVDGDGNVEVYGPGWRAKVKGREALFRCVDARTGAEKWSFPIRGACYGYNRQIYGNSPTMTSTADLDGDGREEVLFGIQNTIMAVAVPQGEEKGQILWEVNLPGKAGSPTPAYLGGKACLLCTCGDGKLYVIG